MGIGSFVKNMLGLTPAKRFEKHRKKLLEIAPERYEAALDRVAGVAEEIQGIEESMEPLVEEKKRIETLTINDFKPIAQKALDIAFNGQRVLSVGDLIGADELATYKNGLLEPIETQIAAYSGSLEELSVQKAEYEATVLGIENLAEKQEELGSDYLGKRGFAPDFPMYREHNTVEKRVELLEAIGVREDIEGMVLGPWEVDGEMKDVTLPEYLSGKHGLSVDAYLNELAETLDDTYFEAITSRTMTADMKSELKGDIHQHAKYL